MSQTESSGGRIEAHVIARLLKVAEKASRLAEAIPAGSPVFAVQRSAAARRPSPYSTSASQPGKQLHDLENARLRATISKLEGEISSVRAEADHLQRIMDSRERIGGGSNAKQDDKTHDEDNDEFPWQPQKWRWRSSQTPNDDLISANSFGGAADNQLAHVMMRAEKAETPVADAQYRARTYARHEQAMSWSHEQKSSYEFGSGMSLDVSIQKALEADGSCYDLAAPLSDSLAIFEDWVGHAPISVIELREKPPVELVREVAVPCAKEIVKEIRTEQRITKEVRAATTSNTSSNWRCLLLAMLTRGEAACVFVCMCVAQVAVPVETEVIKEVRVVTEIGSREHTTSEREVIKPVKVITREPGPVQELIKEVIKEVRAPPPIPPRLFVFVRGAAVAPHISHIPRPNPMAGALSRSLQCRGGLYRPLRTGARGGALQRREASANRQRGSCCRREGVAASRGNSAGGGCA